MSDNDLKFAVTERGFAITHFSDLNGHLCSLQRSSRIADEEGGEAIWLGIDDASPKIMARDAARFGVQTRETTGWVDYPFPEEVLLTTRMHLTQDRIRQLLPVLEYFAEHGELPAETPERVSFEHRILRLERELEEAERALQMSGKTNIRLAEALIEFGRELSATKHQRTEPDLAMTWIPIADADLQDGEIVSIYTSNDKIYLNCDWYGAADKLEFVYRFGASKVCVDIGSVLYILRIKPPAQTV